MKILCVDLGSYSLKFLEVSTERRGLKLIDSSEVILSDIKDQFPVDLPLHLCQLEVVKSYLKSKKFEGSIVLIMPSPLLTSRFLQLPSSNKKKAEQMIPFQLEEDIPHGPGNSHCAFVLRKNSKGYRATVSISSLNFFDEYYKALDQREIIPHYLTTELGVTENFQEIWQLQKAQSKNEKAIGIQTNYAIIDIGHESTKGYFIENNEVISSHISRYAGKHLTESIANSYNIPEEQAENYKQESGFFLTDSQYAEVDKEQADFALMMKQAIWPLVAEIKRWEIGHRVKYTHAVDVIYITGGTSGIKNIANFLTQALKMKVFPLSNAGPLFNLDFSFEEDQRLKYYGPYIAAKALSLKLPLCNMLLGPYSKNFSTGLPLYSIAFLGLRTSLVASIIIAALFVERAILTKEKGKLYLKTVQMLKSPQLGLRPKELKNIKLRPELLLKLVSAKSSEIDREVKMIVGKGQINGLQPLIYLSKNLGSNLNADLERLSYDGKWATGLFSSGIKEELVMIKTRLESMAPVKLQASIKQAGAKHVMEFKFQML